MKYLWILVVFLVMGCGPSKEQVDLVVVNANIYTVDDAFSKAQAFAVQNGRFVAVGSTDEINNKYTSDQIFDAKGLTITPGLIDAHCHFYGLGLNQQWADLTGTLSFAEVLERVQQFQNENPKDFILGRGWDQNDWEIKEFPTKKELDSLFPAIPVVLERVDGHAFLVNQSALDKAGITDETRVEGGEIVKKDAEITGVLVDNPMGLIYAVIPPTNLDTRIRALKEAERICFDNGLTTVDDAGLDRATIELIDSLQQAGDLKIRIYAMVGNSPEDVDYYLKKGPVKTDHLNVRSIKVYGDGALGSRGAVLKKPYADQAGHYGAMITPVSDIENLAGRIANSDFQMNTHAIGDSANAVVLRAYKSVLKDKPGRRWRIEHAQIVDTLDFDYFKLGIIPSVQPTHATSDMYWAGDRLGARSHDGRLRLQNIIGPIGQVGLGYRFSSGTGESFFDLLCGGGPKRC